jgi:hypothetical protein
MGVGDSHEVDMESKSKRALDIHEDALVIAYLQIDEVLVELTPLEECDCVMHKAKWLRWEGNSLLRVWIDG